MLTAPDGRHVTGQSSRTGQSGLTAVFIVAIAERWAVSIMDNAVHAEGTQHPVSRGTEKSHAARKRNLQGGQGHRGPGWGYAPVAVAIIIIVAITAMGISVQRTSTGQSGPREVHYTLEAKEIKMKIGAAEWDAWTYNGQVPGPTLVGNVGEVLVVKLVNKGTKIHSLHTHLTAYPFEMDGTQANVIAGKGAGGMVAPGGQYEYRFNLTEPGLYYYHCHSSDGAMISMHIRMGLYGAIIVKDPNGPKHPDVVLFYGEGQPGAPAPYVINNRGIPGGEQTLEKIFAEEGFDGVAAQLNVSVTFYKFRAGQTVNVHLINIGDAMHSHHGHGMSHRAASLGGRSWPANVVPLVPGQAETLEVTIIEPGLWLFHCHVVNHADMGMIGVFLVE